MSKKNKKEKKPQFVLPEGARWVNKEKTEYWISNCCGHCGTEIDFKYNQYGSLTDPRYWKLLEDGARIPYCDGYHSFEHHLVDYKN